MEDRIRELEERIEKLERKEKRRTIFMVVKVILSILLIAALSYGAYVVYNKVIEEIQPYKEILDNYNEADSKIKSITDLFSR